MGKIYDATCGWAFSASWDRVMSGAEEMGLREMRRQLLSEASGRTIDIGAGTGANIGLFPATVTELTFVEPDRHMVDKLRPKLARAGLPAEVATVGAEDLPFADASIDTAVFVMSLCTIPNPAAALTEVARVLRPGGKMLFLEHVRSEDDRFSRWQDRFEEPWHFFCDGCYCNRDTVATIKASPLTVERVTAEKFPKFPLLVPPLVRPLVLGSAVLPA
jgi:ubiquinone/menaquinone biosynthesis C-methylase UbiE